MTTITVTITVIDVMREKGVQITNELSWSLGAHVRERWQELGHGPPGMKLTPKTNGTGGTHCIAHYPLWFKPEITRILQLYETEKQSQGELFPR